MTIEIEEFKEFKTTGAWPNFDILMTYCIMNRFFFILTFLFLHFFYSIAIILLISAFIHYFGQCSRFGVCCFVT